MPFGIVGASQSILKALNGVGGYGTTEVILGGLGTAAEGRLNCQ